MCTAAATYSFVSSFFWYRGLNCQFQPVLVKDEEQRQQRNKSGNSVANGRGGSDGNDPDPVGIVDSSSSTPVARPQATSWNQTRKLIKEDFSRNNSDGMIDWSYKDSPEFQHPHQGTPYPPDFCVCTGHKQTLGKCGGLIFWVNRNYMTFPI